MAQRVSPTEVKEIIDTNLSDLVVQSSIDIASRYIDKVIPATGDGLDQLRLADIELYLSAHLLAMRDQDEGAVTSEKDGDAEAQYSGFFSKGIEGTRYGQTAIFLDTSGKLAAASISQVKARFSVVAPIDT
jgi:hypothetical protein